MGNWLVEYVYIDGDMKDLFEFGKKQTLRLLLLIEIIALVGSAMAISRDYQDSWVLEGLEIPFAAFMITNIYYFLIEDDSKWLVLFAAFSRFTIFLIPNLKYEWFLGNAIDQHVQFRLARFVCDNGYVESGTLYSETPIMHIFFAIYSNVSSVPLLHSFKYLPVISWALYPIIIYSFIKKVFPEYEKTSLMKWALLISSIPITPHLSFTVTGTIFGSLLAFLSLSEFLKASKTNNKKHLFLFLFFSIVLTNAHFISSILMTLGFLMVFLLKRVLKFFQFNSISSKIPMFLLTINLLWILAQIENATVYRGIVERIFGSFVLGLLGIQQTTWSPTGIRPRFFEVNLPNAFRILTVFYGGTVIVLGLATCGIIAAKKLGLSRTRGSKPSEFLSLYFLSLLSFFPIQFLSTLGKASLLQFHRVFRHALVICPILVAILLYYITNRMRRAKPIIVTIILSVIILNTIETYGYQPLVPPSSAVAEDLPSDEPVVFLAWIGINSIYQRSMIQHIEMYAPLNLRLASDQITQNQIIGLADYRYSDQVINYHPLSKFLDENVRERDYDLFLIHFPGKAGPLSEQAEIRTKTLILETIQNSSILYTNGESFVLVYPGVES